MLTITAESLKGVMMHRFTFDRAHAPLLCTYIPSHILHCKIMITSWLFASFLHYVYLPVHRRYLFSFKKCAKAIIANLDRVYIFALRFLLFKNEEKLEV